MIARSLSERERGLPYELLFLCRPGMQDQFFGFEAHEVRTPFLSARELLMLPWILRRLSGSLYHSPSFSSVPGLSIPWLLTLHDLNHLTFGNPLEKVYYETVLRPFAAHSQKILTVSKVVALEVRQWLERRSQAPLPPIEVVPNALDPLWSAAHGTLATEYLKRWGLSHRGYFLCFSNEKPHKNLPILFRAYANYRVKTESRGERPLSLVTNVERYAAEPGVKSLREPTDPELRALVGGARRVYFPSRYEGFGFPPVESLLAGTPVAVSEIPAFREVLGPRATPPAGVHWIHVDHLEGWTSAFEVKESVVDPQLQAELRETYNAATFGDRLDRVYRSILKLGGS
jgi:glycosyltransferase involved in cell wall biosynthesis